MYFKIILSILSRTEERIVEFQDIFSHLKRSIDFITESKKIAKRISYYIILEEFLFLFLEHYVSVSSAMFIREVGFTFIPERFSIIFGIQVITIFKFSLFICTYNVVSFLYILISTGYFVLLRDVSMLCFDYQEFLGT